MSHKLTIPNAELTLSITAGDAARALDRFMQLKARVISEFADPALLWNPRIDSVKMFLHYPPETLALMIASVTEAVAIHRLSGLSSALCPFCIAHTDPATGKVACSACHYAKHHGQCGSDDSDFKRLIDRIPSFTIPTNPDYIEILQDSGVYSLYLEIADAIKPGLVLTDFRVRDRAELCSAQIPIPVFFLQDSDFRHHIALLSDIITGGV